MKGFLTIRQILTLLLIELGTMAMLYFAIYIAPPIIKIIPFVLIVLWAGLCAVATHLAFRRKQR